MQTLCFRWVRVAALVLVAAVTSMAACGSDDGCGCHTGGTAGMYPDAALAEPSAGGSASTLDGGR